MTLMCTCAWQILQWMTRCRPHCCRWGLNNPRPTPFVRLSIGRTGTKLCPVAALLVFIASKGTVPGPLFTFQDGSFLSRPKFVELVRDALVKEGFDQQRYCDHSFRIGAATTAAKKGLEDSIIKTLGRWESVTYLQYVKFPREQMAGYAKLLVS